MSRRESPIKEFVPYFNSDEYLKYRGLSPKSVENYKKEKKIVDAALQKVRDYVENKRVKKEKEEREKKMHIANQYWTMTPGRYLNESVKHMLGLRKKSGGRRLSKKGTRRHSKKKGTRRH